MARAKGTTPRNKTSATSTGAQQDPQAAVSPEDRQRMIAEVAYFRAQARGFKEGDPIDDWLAAELEVSRALPPVKQQKEEQAVYEKLRAAVQQKLADARESVDAGTIRDAVEKGADQLRQVGEHAADTINRAVESLEKDIAGAAAIMGPRWEAFSEKTANVFSVWRDRGSTFLARAAVAAGDWLNETGQRLERPHYHAGELAASGSFECLRCGEVVRLETSAHVPPCPKCRNLDFRRAA